MEVGSWIIMMVVAESVVVVAMVVMVIVGVANYKDYSIKLEMVIPHSLAGSLERELI